MAQNPPDVNNFPSIFDRGDQPASVVTYIKHNVAPNNVGVSPTIPNISETLPICTFGYFVPCVQRSTPFVVLFASFSNRLSADDPHEKSSHYAKIMSMGNLILGTRYGELTRNAQGIPPAVRFARGAKSARFLNVPNRFCAGWSAAAHELRAPKSAPSPHAQSPRQEPLPHARRAQSQPRRCRKESA